MSEDILFLDYQSTTPVIPEVQAAMVPYLATLFANPSSRDHLLGEMVNDSFIQFREQAAQLLGVRGEELLFTSGATESANLAIFGLLPSLVNGSRRKVLVSPLEHACVLEPLRELVRRNIISVEWLTEIEGYHSTDSILTAVDDDTIAVVLMSVNNEIGTIHNDPRLALELRRLGVVYLADHSQSVGKIELINPHSATMLGDVAIFSGHKMYGPKGIGMLYARSDLMRQVRPLFFGGGQQQGLRPGTIPLSLIAGFVTALEISMRQCHHWSEFVIGLRDGILKILHERGVRFSVNGPEFDVRVPHNLNIHFHGIPSSVILLEFPALAVSSGSACSRGGDTYSRILLALGLSKDASAESLRFGLSHCVDRKRCLNMMVNFADTVCRLQDLNPSNSSRAANGY